MKFKRRQLIQGMAALSTVALFSSVARALTDADIVTVAKQISVRVISAGEPGTGILIHREGNTYSVLTAWHVIKDTNTNEEIIVITPDGEYHLVPPGDRKQQQNLDLAVVQFESDRNYPIATIGDSQRVGELYEVIVAGYSNRGVGGTQLSTVEITSGNVSALGDFGEGYALRYTSATASGMSGGPVLNREGQLIGVHGRAEGSIVNGVPLKEGFNYGIPIHTFLAGTSLHLGIAPPIAQPPQQRGSETPNLAGRSERFRFDVVRVNRIGSAIDRQPNEASFFIEELGDGLGLEMVKIPGGNFLMGSPNGEEGRLPDEGPQRQVTVAEFYMGKYEISQAEWRAVSQLPQLSIALNANPSEFIGDRRPVESVTWLEAKEFCARLSLASGIGYRLPSEAEWEYACRGKTTTPFYFGETLTEELANYDATIAYAEESVGKRHESTTNIGRFSPNAFGLHDMHGNVWEWCEDTYHDSYGGAPSEGTPWVGSGVGRVLRGGGLGLQPQKLSLGL